MPDRDKSKDTDENGRVSNRILFGASAIKNDRGELVINDSYTIYSTTMEMKKTTNYLNDLCLQN